MIADFPPISSVPTTIQNQDFKAARALLQRLQLVRFAFRRALEVLLLLDMARSLWLRFGPSLRVVMQRWGSANLPDRHEEALAAMRAGDTASLALAIQNDIQQGIDQIRLAQAQGAV